VIVAAIVLVVLVTVLIGARGVAAIRSTSDFLVASRRISPALNAAAVSGEYLSAASFLGVAGLVLKDGIGALWYGVGFTAGYIAMLALVAAPMRRTGALTVPDFAEARLGSAGLRRLSGVVVLVIATLYLVPQFKAAGLVLTVVSGTPYWVGVVVAGAAVSITLALGGMRAATYVQAFQFGLKLLLFIVPAIWLVLQVGADTRREALAPVEFTRFERPSPVEFRLDVELTVTEPTPVTVSGRPPEVLAPGRYGASAGSTWTFAEGAAVPEVAGVSVVSRRMAIPVTTMTCVDRNISTRQAATSFTIHKPATANTDHWRRRSSRRRRPPDQPARHPLPFGSHSVGPN